MGIIPRQVSAKLLADLLEFKALNLKYNPKRLENIIKAIKEIEGLALIAPPPGLIDDLKAIKRKNQLARKIESGLDFLGEIDLKLDQKELEGLCEQVIVYGVTRHNIFSRATSEFLATQLMWLDNTPFTPEEGIAWIQKKLDEFGGDKGYTIDVCLCPICVRNREQSVIIFNSEFREEMMKTGVKIMDHLEQLFAELNPDNSGYSKDDLPHWGCNND